MWTKIVSGVGHVLKSYLTAPDGESYAPGRIMGFAVFIIGQWVTVFVTLHAYEKAPPAIAELQMLLVGLAAFEGAICATSIGLVLGMAPSDSGGKWWGKDASPPPPPTDAKP